MIFGNKFDITLQLMLCGKQSIAKSITSLISELPPSILSDIRKHSNTTDTFQTTKTIKFDTSISYVYECIISNNKLSIRKLKFNDKEILLKETFLEIKGYNKIDINNPGDFDLGFIAFTDNTKLINEDKSTIIDFKIKKRQLSSKIILTYNNNNVKTYIISNTLIDKTLIPIAISELKTANRPKTLIRHKKNPYL